MIGRFVAYVHTMRRGLSRPDRMLTSGSKRNRQYDLAGRIASRNVDWAARPKEWDVFFRRALAEIQQQEREFQEVSR